MKMENVEKVMINENGGLYAAIGGIVLVYGLDRITRSHYKVEAGKESVSVAPAMEQKTTESENPEKPLQESVLSP